MWPFIVRTLIAAAIAGGGLAFGRRMLDRKIEEQVPKEIETARRVAIAELDKAADIVIGERLLAFLTALLVKAGLVGGAYWLYAIGDLNAEGLRIVGAVLIVFFIVRDLANVLPFALPALRILRGHNWKFRAALTEFVAGVSFERAYAEAIRATTSGSAGQWIAFSKYNAHNISTEIAVAVADVARSVAFDLIRVRAVIALISALAMFGAYWVFFVVTIGGLRLG
ncbi:MAG TPA: hypothetical protein VNH64_09465 [Parvularculaceae bacterium]|nr:hypothetical protein [Parvularculaceae bacterium]